MLLHLTSGTSAIAVSLGGSRLYRRALLSIANSLLASRLGICDGLLEFLFHYLIGVMFSGTCWFVGTGTRIFSAIRKS